MEKALSLHARLVAPGIAKCVKIMKLVILLTIIAFMHAAANGYSQTITLSLKNVPLEKAFTEIQKQSEYSFVYVKEELQNTSPVTINVINASLSEVLDICFKDQPVSHFFSEKFIIVKQAPKKVLIDVKGKVIDENGEPVAATIRLKGTDVMTSTNSKGEFTLPVIDPGSILTITGAELETQELRINGRSFIIITVRTKIHDLDQAIVMAYGVTTKRLNTGNIGKVTSDEISKQPVGNPLAALEGRIPGLLVTQSSGVPGAVFKIQIRGQNSIGTSPGNLPADNPLFVIDGIPYARGNNIISQISSSANNPYQASQGGLSPFNLIDPTLIESIEVLKDADATAIYGSRGANGVILITTKKGKAGKTKFSASFYSGISMITRTMDMLNTKQYLEMRQEAYRNDGMIPTTSNAPDLLKWDTTRFTDFKKLLIGGKAHLTNAQLSFSGGSHNTRYLLGAVYNKETTVFPGDMADSKGSVHFSLNQSSTDKKFNSVFNAIYLSDKNNLAAKDLTGYINLPPNAPPVYDASGKLNWQENGASISDLGFINPLSFLLQKYSSRSDNLLGNLNMDYQVIKGLFLRLSAGYNTSNVNETAIRPKSSFDPLSNALASSQFGFSNAKTWDIEPQAEYQSVIGKGKLSALIGCTWQDMQYNSNSISASGYTNDLLLQSLNAAANTSSVNNLVKYRYEAIFGRLNFNWRDRYIANITGRRDGSSRFGPGRQFANFGAIGTAWIFSNEGFIQKKLSWLSFGKLRGSYGTTGSDQIDDYSFLDLWSSTIRPYQNTPGLTPTRLFNPDYNWQVNHKLEFAIDLGLINDRVLISAAYFRNRCGNQLIKYILPAQTGFQSINKNFDAVVENSGWEFSASSKNVNSKNLSWSTSFNISLPKNKLISFPDLSSSSYSINYIIGKPLSVIYRYQFLGVNPTTGVYAFQDINNDGTLNSKDYIASGSLDPKFYGGLQNTIKYKQWQLALFIEFRKQLAQNYLASQSYYEPGLYFNQPRIVLNRWRKPGDNADIQKFSQTFASAFAAFANQLSLSNGIYSDASYLRFKNAYLSYSLSSVWMNKIHLESARIYVQAQNIFTVTNYVGSDPENHNFYVLPPLKTIVAGIQLTF